MQNLKIISAKTVLPKRRSVREMGLQNGVDMSLYDGWDNVRVAEKTDHPSTMAAQALRKAIEAAGISPADLKIIIGQHATHDYSLPWSLSLEVLGMLDLPRTCLALDINATCAGCAFGLDLARSWLSANGGGYAAIVSGERSSMYIDRKAPDRDSTWSWSDGGGAMIVGLDVNHGPILANFKGFSFRSTPIFNTLVSRMVGGTRVETPDEMYQIVRTVSKAEAGKMFLDNVKECVTELKSKFSIPSFDCIIPTLSTNNFVKMLPIVIKEDQKNFVNLGNDIGHVMAIDIIAGIERAHEEDRLRGNTLLTGFGEAMAFAAWLSGSNHP